MTSNKTILPIKYQEKFENLLSELENESGEMYQITINKFGSISHCEQIIGDFASRNLKIEVYDCDPKFFELLGKYDSRNDLINKIKKLNNDIAFSEIIESTNDSGRNVIIGKCIKCGHNNHVSIALCQNKKCKMDFRSDWFYVEVSKYDYSIYICYGGRYAPCTTIAKYRFV